MILLLMKDSYQSFCSLPVVPEKKFDSDISPERVELIRILNPIWVNGTIIHYYFFDNVEWGTNDETQKNIVRNAFKEWKDLDIGLEFEEVQSAGAAEIRIGFKKNRRSYTTSLGRGILETGENLPNMNFGWDLSRPGESDTALHEIGHALGFPHEHQNPNAGFVWDEEKAYQYYTTTQGWPPDVIYHNVLRKLSRDEVTGTNWDANSIMHYPVAPGLILQPEQFGQNGIDPNPGLSQKDKDQVKLFYPLIDNIDYPELAFLECKHFSIAPGEQVNFTLRPQFSNDYNIRTIGGSDIVMVLFEKDNANLRFIAGDDDSGTNQNASINTRLIAGREYVLRIRLYSQFTTGGTSVIWSQDLS